MRREQGRGSEGVEFESKGFFGRVREEDRAGGKRGRLVWQEY
jgi:hypothetical protein